MSNQAPTAKQMDDAGINSIRDILTEAAPKFAPAMRTAFLEIANGAMTHIAQRLELLQSKETPNEP